MPDIQEVGFGRVTADTTVVTTAETEAAESGRIAVPRANMTALIIAFINLDSGAGTTAVTPRIRNGTDTGGTLVSEAIAHETTAAEAATWVVTATEVLGDVGEVQYIASVLQTGATGNGTINNATIIVLLL